jgi:hypothetical protein
MILRSRMAPHQLALGCLGAHAAAQTAATQAGAVPAEEPAATLAAGSVAPGIRGSVALEPGRVRAGDVATLEIVVATPPDHQVRPIAPPAELPGFWILDAVALPIEKADGRWIHRTRVRLRARALGQYVWPAQPVEIETPDGKTQRLVLDGRPLEVVSVQPEFPGRRVPFGLREAAPAGASPPGSAWGAAAAGAAASAAALGLVGAIRRARRLPHPRGAAGEPAPAAPAAAPWRAASQALDDAARRLEADPAAASDALARTLRRYVTLRFRFDVAALTTPELARAAPPAEAVPHWPELIRLLRALDDARFLPAPALRPEPASRIRDELARARAFVALTIPPAARP